MKKARISIFQLWYAIILSMIMLVSFGCEQAYVKDHPVENNGFAASPDLKGAKSDVLAYFDERYPPDTWSPKIGGSLAVGPVMVSREALLYLEGDKTDRVSIRAESGSAKNAVVVKSGKGSTQYFLSKKESYQAQAVVTETLTNEKRFRVFSLDRDVSEALLTGVKSYESLLGDGIRYLVNGNLSMDEGTKGVTVYLRLIDTSNMKIVCATSSKGATVEEASRGAAQGIISRLSGGRQS